MQALARLWSSTESGPLVLFPSRPLELEPWKSHVLQKGGHPMTAASRLFQRIWDGRNIFQLKSTQFPLCLCLGNIHDENLDSMILYELCKPGWCYSTLAGVAFGLHWRPSRSPGKVWPKQLQSKTLCHLYFKGCLCVVATWSFSKWLAFCAVQERSRVVSLATWGRDGKPLGCAFVPVCQVKKRDIKEIQ